jgi:hypothetical protein
MAVGASISRIARQLTTEAGLMVAAASVLGLTGSIGLSSLLRELRFFREARWHNVTLLDWRVLVLAGAVVLVLTMLVSLAPILGIRSLRIAASSEATTSRASLAQRLAGTAQVAIAASLGSAAIAFSWYLGSLLLDVPG